MSEFYAAPEAPDLGDPATDPPMTVRVERWEDRLGTHVRRAIKSDDPYGPWPWCVVGGLPNGRRWLANEDVAAWPVCPAVVNEAAYHLATNRGPREGLAQPAERGDLDADAFRGGKP